MPRNRTSHQPPEMTSLDARIAKAGGTTSTVDLMSSRLHSVAGDHDHEDRTKPMSQEDLVREIGKLRQELVLHKESRNALMLSHYSTQHFETFQRRLTRARVIFWNTGESFWEIQERTISPDCDTVYITAA